MVTSALYLVPKFLAPVWGIEFREFGSSGNSTLISARRRRAPPQPSLNHLRAILRKWPVTHS